MEAKYDLWVCGHIRDHHQYYLTGGETAQLFIYFCSSTLKKYVEHVNSMSDESQELFQSIPRRDNKCT
jgi:hypothetical protein